MVNPLRICAIASEAAPFAKTGGLADVTAALTKYLHAQGHDVRLFMPLYGLIDRSRFALTPVPRLTDRTVTLAVHRYQYSVYTATLPGSQAVVHLIDCPPLYARAAIYSLEPDEHLRFLALTRIAIECCQYLAFSPQILHCHDWHAAFGPLLLRAHYGWDRLFAATRTVLTIHNIGYQGEFAASAAADLGLGDNAYLLHQDDLRGGRINALKHGCMYADAITTVSPTYAAEIRTPEYGWGLQDVLQARATALVGILNGVDYEDWDPRHDRHLSAHYDATRLPVKAALKKEFLGRMGLNGGPDTVLAGSVTRLATQKGIELVLGALPRLLAQRDLAFVALGAGEARYEQGLRDLAAAWPGRVAFHQGYDEALAHWIEAASDLFLMPSQYEPCGLNQMYSLRYGTVPVVRRTGGLADSVQRYDPATGAGTGVVFEPFSASALASAVESALDLHADPRHWQRLVRNGMAQDFSWNRQGGLYIELFAQMLAARVAV
ncbi:MAG TPA: glycogen synthase [Steroidobacteraceae bacterium]|nr:glycogen synthase [Steroidobacteraceae bacterium]